MCPTKRVAVVFRECEGHSPEQNTYLESVADSFFAACRLMPDDVFVNKKNRRFNIALYEAVFTATSEKALTERRVLQGQLDSAQVSTLEVDEEFQKASLEGRTRTANVEKRLERGRAIVSAL